MAFLLQKGYRVIHRNWRMKIGEIDIIAEDSGTLVFCEVKSRSSLDYGSGAEAVNGQKQHRIMLTALLYMQCFHISEHADCKACLLCIQNGKAKKRF